MAYDTKIESTEQPIFAELYEFQVGAIINRYTSHLIDVEYNGETYYARPIKRGDFSFTEKLRSVRVRINAPIDATLSKYVANAPVEPVLVKIIRVFQDGSNDAVQIFQGEIIDVTEKSKAYSGQVKFLKSVAVEADEVNLEEADVIVAGGRGVGSAENFKKYIEGLAKILGGVPAASRGALDSDYAGYSVRRLLGNCHAGDRRRRQPIGTGEHSGPWQSQYHYRDRQTARRPDRQRKG